MARYAHHALAAGERSTADAQTAVEACRIAAGTMVAGLAYEQAADLLCAAVATHERAGLDTSTAPLLLEWADAVLMCGRLIEARALFDRAVNAALLEGDAVLLARAALGLGGMWVNEHRTQVDHRRVIGLQRRALASLPEGQVALRLRLTVRLAVEDLYWGGPVEPVLAALDAARGLGDDRVLAEALSLVHHALLTARHTKTRLALANELITAATACDHGLLALIGLCWRTVDLFHLGHPEARRSLTELHDRADALRCQSVLYIAEAMEVMLLIRAGRLDEAEIRAHACFKLATEVGDADAGGYLGVHLVTIRWLQGREDELLTTIEQLCESPDLNPAEFGFRATAARLAARAGHTDKARMYLDRIATPDLAALPDSSTWLAGMLAVVETAHLLSDGRLARQAYELLRPYADLPIMPSLAVTCFGSTHRPLGLAALAFDDPDLAITHLRRAVSANQTLGNLPVTAIAQADLAEAHLRRQAAGDRDSAAALLAAARDRAAAPAWAGRVPPIRTAPAVKGAIRNARVFTVVSRCCWLIAFTGLPVSARLLITEA